MIELKLTQDEANALAALLDAAVKATGMQGAKVAVPIYTKLEVAMSSPHANAFIPAVNSEE